MLEEQANSVEAALWSAVRALDERAHLLRRMAGRLGSSARRSTRYERDASAAEGQARVIRDQVLAAGQSATAPGVPDMEAAGS
jgi:two-component system chemotaxis response regulator CheB